MADDGCRLLEALGTVQSLRELYLGYALLGADGACALARALPLMEQLRTLFLRDNGIDSV